MVVEQRVASSEGRGGRQPSMSRPPQRGLELN